MRGKTEIREKQKHNLDGFLGGLFLLMSVLIFFGILLLHSKYYIQGFVLNVYACFLWFLYLKAIGWFDNNIVG